MVDKLLGLWDTKRWLFFVLIIPVGIAFVYNLLISSDVKGAKKDVKAAEKADIELKEKEDKANAVADRLKEDADKIENNIDNLKNDEDWNK